MGRTVELVGDELAKPSSSSRSVTTSGKRNQSFVELRSVRMTARHPFRASPASPISTCVASGKPRLPALRSAARKRKVFPYRQMRQ
jgi:hypothetical protein